MTDTMNKLFFRIGSLICGLFAMLSCGVSLLSGTFTGQQWYNITNDIFGALPRVSLGFQF